VSGGDDATVRVWDLESGELLHKPLQGHDGNVNALTVGDLRGRAMVASGGNDRTVRLWDLVSGQPLGGPLQGHRRRVRAVAMGEFHGRPIVVSGSNDNTVRVWDLDAGRLLYEPLVGHRGNVTAVAVGQVRGRPIAVSAGEDFTLWVWDLEAGGRQGTLDGHEGFVHAVALGELGGRPVAVSGGGDKTIRVWALDTGEALGRPLVGHRDWVNAVAVGAFGGGRQIAVSGGNDRTVRVWDLERFEPVAEPLVGHEDWVNAVALGGIGDRSIAVSGGDDNTVHMWDLSTGGSLGALPHHRAVNAVALGVLHGGPPPASRDSHRNTAEPTARQVDTDRQRHDETAPTPAATGSSPSPESVMAGSSTRPESVVAGSPTRPESVVAGSANSLTRSAGRTPAIRPSARPPRRQPRREPPRSSALVVSLFSLMVLGGLALTVFAVHDLTDLLRAPSSSQRADGTVIRVDTATTGSGADRHTSHHPVVRFVTAREQVIEFTSNLDVGYRVGDSVKVRYDPENPHHARLDSPRARIGSGVLDLIMLLGGLFLTLVGGLLLWAAVRGEPTAQPRRRVARRPHQ
jgi:hypothetical protein